MSLTIGLCLTRPKKTCLRNSQWRAQQHRLVTLGAAGDPLGYRPPRFSSSASRSELLQHLAKAQVQTGHVLTVTWIIGQRVYAVPRCRPQWTKTGFKPFGEIPRSVCGVDSAGRGGVAGHLACVLCSGSGRPALGERRRHNVQTHPCSQTRRWEQAVRASLGSKKMPRGPPSPPLSHVSHNPLSILGVRAPSLGGTQQDALGI